MTAELHVVRVGPGAEREAYLPLLHLADEPEPVRGYLQAPESDLYVLRHADGEPLGVTFVLPHAGEEGTVELRAVAVDPTRHHQGLGREMLARVLDDLRSRGTRRVIVGTSNAGIWQIAFYQKAGFRLWRIERDYFTPEKGYDPDERENGLSHRDMIWFDQVLTPDDPRLVTADAR